MKGRILKFEGSVHAEVDRLLPWWVNGTLAGPERMQVEQHLAGCMPCRREAAWLRMLQDGYPDDTPAAGGAPHAMRRLRRRLAARGMPAHAPSAASWRRRSRKLAWLAAVQAVLILGLGAALLRDRQPAYHTLGAAPGKTALLVVGFDPRISEARLRALLRAHDARIVGGPTAAGAYLLRVPDERADAVRKALHDSGEVTLVESLGAGGTP